MHNLLLSTAKNIMRIWKDNSLIRVSELNDIEAKIDAVNPPANIGRIPGKIEQISLPSQVSYGKHGELFVITFYCRNIFNCGASL